jgi:mycothiol synthase
VTVRVRPFADRDYTALARIRTTGEADRTTPDSARAVDARWDWSRYERVRVVAVDEEDAPLGYAEIYHEPSRFDPRRYFLRLAVDLRMRRRGIGALLWTHVLAELDERRALGVYAWARDSTAGASFLAKRRFAEVVRYYNQVRAVGTAPVPTPSSEERLAAAGIRIASLAELMRDDPRAAEKAFDLYYASREDQATLGRVTPVAFAAWRAHHVDDEAALPDGYFIALDGDAFVGQSTARRAAADDVVDIGVTGVLPSHRRRGIGRALKLRLHGYARANSYREIHTTTVRQNPPMVALNDSLGYVIVESYAGYELALGASIPSSP